MKEKVKSYVYILYCADDSYYTGWTMDIDQRLKAHNGKVPNGAKYTKSRRPVKLAWLVACDDKIDAQRLEYYIKRLPRPKKIALMAGDERLWHKLKEDYICKGNCVIIKG